MVAAYRQGGLPAVDRYVDSDEARDPFLDMYRDLYGRVLPDEATKLYRALWKAHKAHGEEATEEELDEAWLLAIAVLLASVHSRTSPAGKIVTAMLHATRDQATDIVERAIAEGVLAGDIASELQRKLQGLTPGRARVIAKTELQRAHNTARQTGAEAYAKDSGRSLVKVWRWSHVSRENHAATDGQRRALNEDFDVGGFAAAYPHDPALPASESVNCSCFVDYEEE